MKKILCLLAGTVLVGLLVVPAAAPAAPVNVQCNGTLTGGPFHDVTVPAGGSCSISGATITGNVTARIDATVSVSDSTIDGNYKCSNCSFADMHLNSTVGGNVLIHGETDGSFINGGNVIEGNLQITTSSADGDMFQIDANSVGGNLIFNNNTGDSAITDNTISGNLVCQNNVPPPVSAGNTATSHLGQCAA